MFEKLCIPPGRGPSSHLIDLGSLAEALVFYGRVHLVVNRGTLRSLLHTLSPDELLALIEEDFLSVEYLENGNGVLTKQMPHGSVHSLNLYQMEGEGFRSVAEQIMFDLLGGRGKARRIANRLQKRVSDVRYDQELLTASLNDLASKGFVHAAVFALLDEAVPGQVQADGFVFDVAQETNGLRVQTDLGFDHLNKAYHRRVPKEHSSLSAAYLLSNLLHVRSQEWFAARTDADIASSPSDKTILQLADLELLRHFRAMEALEQVAQFQEVVFRNRCIGDVIRSGERTFKDLLPVLREAKDYKGWLQGKAPDESLIQAYVAEISKRSWVDKLPSRFVRWSTLTTLGPLLDVAGAGGLGTATAMALGAFDAFLFEKLAKGWKPNKFIDEHLSPFVGRQTSK